MPSCHIGHEGPVQASKAPILEAPEALGEVVGEPRERRAGSAICTSDTSEERRYFEYLDALRLSLAQDVCGTFVVQHLVGAVRSLNF